MSSEKPITLDVIQVVGRVDPRKELPQKLQPSRLPRASPPRHLDEIGDMRRVDSFASCEGARGTALQGGNRSGQFFRDDLLTQVFVGQAIAVQVVIVEEMAEGAVPHVVQEPREPARLFDKTGRRDVGADTLEAGVEMPTEFPRHVHGSQGVLETGVLGGGIDPARALELVNPPEPLEPGRVEEVPLGLFPGAGGIGDGEPRVLVDGIGDERLPRVNLRE